MSCDLLAFIVIELSSSECTVSVPIPVTIGVCDCVRVSLLLVLKDCERNEIIIE